MTLLLFKILRASTTPNCSWVRMMQSQSLFLISLKILALFRTVKSLLPLAYAAAGLPAEREVSSLRALCDACLDVLYERDDEGA